MSNHISNTAYNMVPVIASFDSEGHVRPLYVRINEVSLKIYSSYEKPSFHGFMEFQCKVIDNNCLKPLILTYHKRENIWSTPRQYT